MQDVHRALDARSHRLFGIALVMLRRSAREIEDPLGVDLDRRGDVVPDELEIRVATEGGEIVEIAGDQIVDRDNLISLVQQPNT